jgi:hypothetical protein
MRVTKEVLIGDARIVVTELTVADLRAWLSDLSTTPSDTIGDELFDGVTLHELTWMSSLDPAKAGALAPSELQQVVDACKEVNAHFFALRGKLVERGRKLAATSNSPPAP